MPLVPAVMQAKLSTEIVAELTKAFGGGADAATGASSHKKMADAIAAAVSKVLIAELTTNAQVLPGIPSTPSSTVGPGKIA